MSKFHQIKSIRFPLNRAFNWRVWILLVMLYFFGNLAGIPLLRKTGIPIEPIWQWGVVTLISAIVIAFSLWMATLTELGAPLFDGKISKEELPHWIRNGLAFSILAIVVTSPFSILVNLNADTTTYPFGWELLLASFKAGVVEEIVGRFFLMTLIVWIGRFFSQGLEGHPTKRVYWMGILLSGLIFGWAHVDARLGMSDMALWWFVVVMVLNSGLGVFFGWLFWKSGLEWAIIAHFLFDVYLSMILVPVYLLATPVVWVILIVGLLVAGFMASRYLVRSKVALSS